MPKFILAPKSGGIAYQKPSLMSQMSTTYSEQTGQVWDIFDDKNVENYMKLTEASVKYYGRPDLFHTIGLAERKFSDDPRRIWS